MNPVNSSTTTVYSPQSLKSQAATHTKTQKTEVPGNNTKVEQNTVTLSAEGKALLKQLQEIEKAGKPQTEKTVGDKVESFTYGALGIEHPDKLKEDNDTSYSAGQFVSAAATIGGILLALV